MAGCGKQVRNLSYQDGTNTHANHKNKQSSKTRSAQTNNRISQFVKGGVRVVNMVVNRKS